MEILAAAFGVTTTTMVAASVINAALEQQLLHLQDLLRSALTVWHSFPFGGNKYPWGCSKGGMQETKDSRRRTAPHVSP